MTRWLCIAVLLIVASGWRPRFTGALHWWIAWSLQSSAITIDGGDQVTAVLTLLLLPVTLTDGRIWHWAQVDHPNSPGMREELKRLVALSALVLIRLQVAGIYFHASMGKFGVKEWVDGTALYYWLTDPVFGAADWLLPALKPVLTHGATVALLTWGVMILEFFLAAALIATIRMRGSLLVAGIALHLGIAIIHGLVSFALAMIAALVLHLRPVTLEFRFSLVKKLLPWRSFGPVLNSVKEVSNPCLP